MKTYTPIADRPLTVVQRLQAPAHPPRNPARPAGIFG